MAENTQSKTIIKVLIAVLVLFAVYWLFFDEDKPETTTEDPALISGPDKKEPESEQAGSGDKTPDQSNEQVSAETLKNLDVKTLLTLKRIIKDSTVFIAIDEQGNRTLLGKDLEKGERCIPDANTQKSADKTKRCAAFNKDSELLSVENSSLMISKGSYIFTYFVNGVVYQICYDDHWNRIACP
ncbi:MAG TPA: hypothetical protein VIM85_02735 [Pseudomonadales bacterium]